METGQQNAFAGGRLGIRNLRILLSEAEELIAPLNSDAVQEKIDSLKSSLSIAVQSSIRRGLERRDTDALAKRFHSWSKGSGLLSAEQLESCLLEIGVHSDGLVLSSMDSNDDGQIDLSEFQRFVATRRSSVARWTDCIPFADVMADALSAVIQNKQNPLQEIGSLSEETVSVVFESVVPVIQSLFLQALKLLKISNDSSKELGPTENRASKFEVSVLSTGNVEDFHKGLEGRIGPMSLNYEAAVKFEHCCEKASRFEFKSLNYLIVTNSDREMRLVEERRGKSEFEWAQILREEFAVVGMGKEHHGRRIPDVDALIKLPIAKRSNLNLTEVKVVVLYTGPMYTLYNTELRRFPLDMLQRLKEAGLSFVTTIHVLVSALMKICNNANVPEGTVLYRGLGGKGLPQSFYKADSKGRKGFTEWGFSSTTAERKMALQYSGVQAGSRHAVVLRIRTGAVDRGACIQELSQYEDEAEYLWLPLSLLEPDGEPNLVASPHGLVLVVPVRIVPNFKAVTVEENVSRKKDIHMMAFRYNLMETQEQLFHRIREPDAVERFRDDISKNNQGHHTLDGFVGDIMKKLQAVMDSHKLLPANEYIKDDVYREQVLYMLQAKTRATSLLRLYLEDKNQYICDMGVICLMQAHRDLTAFHYRRMACAQSDDERIASATDVCRLRGLIRHAADEKNADGEVVGVSAAAGGLGRADLQVLFQAGAFKNVEVAGEALRKAAQFCHLDALELLLDDVKVAADTADQDGWTALMAASTLGQEGAVKLLLDVKADVNAAKMNGWTALMVASSNGCEGATVLLLDGKADVNAADKDGWTALMWAGFSKHEGVVKLLLERKADVNAARMDGGTALIPASLQGHVGVVKLLMQGKADMNASRKDGWTALIAASTQGREGVVTLLLEGKADMNVAMMDGLTAVMAACYEGREGVVALLLEGKAEVNSSMKDGATALMMAGFKGHGWAVGRLLDKKVDVNATDKSGRSALHTSAQAGRLGAVQALLAAAADPDASMHAGDTPLSCAASAGSWDCVNALLQALGGDKNHGSADEMRERVAAWHRKDAVGWTAVHYALAAAGAGSVTAADWLAVVQPALGGELLEAARCDVAGAAAARAGIGSVWPERWRGDVDEVVMVEGPVPAVVHFPRLGTARVNCCCPAGAQGYYELELLHYGLIGAQFGFCESKWRNIKIFSNKGVGDEGDSWAADGARGTWRSGREGGRAEAFVPAWKPGDVIGLACDLAGMEGGRLLVGVNGDWSGAEALGLPRDIQGLLPAFTAFRTTVRCNLAGPFRHPPPSPDFLPMASFPPTSPPT